MVAGVCDPEVQSMDRQNKSRWEKLLHCGCTGELPAVIECNRVILKKSIAVKVS